MIGVVGNWKKSSSAASTIDPSSASQSFEHFDDFHNYQFPSASGPLNGFWSVSGTGNFAKVDPTSSILNRVGIVQWQCGATAASHASYVASNTDIQLGGATVTFATALNISAAPTAGEDFAVRIGLINTFPGLGQHAVLFTCDRTLSTTNWQAVTRQASTNTVADTGIALATGYNNFRFVINAGTNVQFYINGNPVATNTTNLPLSNGQAIGPIIQIQKVAGSSGQTFNCDWLYYKYVLGSARGTF